MRPSPTHPLLRPGGIFIPTPQFAAAKREVERLLRANCGAVSLVGEPGTGKTTAALEMLQSVSEWAVIGSALVPRLPAGAHPKKAANAVQHALLRGLFGGLRALRGHGGTIDTAFFSSLKVECDRRDTRNAVFLVRQEGGIQAASLAALQTAAELLRSDVQPSRRTELQFLFVMATSEVKVADALREAGRADVARCLLNATVQYRPFPLEILGALFGTFDEKLQVDGQSFTEAFAPKWWVRGWRLRDAASPALEALRRQASLRRFSIPTTAKLPDLLRHIRLVLLRASSLQDKPPSPQLLTELFEEAVRSDA